MPRPGRVRAHRQVSSAGSECKVTIYYQRKYIFERKALDAVLLDLKPSVHVLNAEALLHALCYVDYDSLPFVLLLPQPHAARGKGPCKRG